MRNAVKSIRTYCPQHWGIKGEIELVNIVETYGHDDSNPFQADIHIVENGISTKVGEAWDDGWGGEIQIHMTKNDSRLAEICKAIKSRCKVQTRYGEMSLNQNLLIGSMAEKAIFENKTVFFIVPEWQEMAEYFTR